MKKTIMAIAATLMMSGSMFAQESENGDKNPMEKPDKTEMVKKRTDETARRYGLNDEQAAKLLDLNTRYAEKMGPRGPRMGRHHAPGGQRPDSIKSGKMKPQKGELKKAHMKGEGQQVMKGGREDMRKNMEEYDAELQTIMTAEQYEAYKADHEKRMKDGPRAQRPQEPEE